eukprot:1820928-Prymnesium_polylepis.1
MIAGTVVPLAERKAAEMAQVAEMAPVAEDKVPEVVLEVWVVGKELEVAVAAAPAMEVGRLAVLVTAGNMAEAWVVVLLGLVVEVMVRVAA